MMAVTKGALTGPEPLPHAAMVKLAQVISACRVRVALVGTRRVSNVYCSMNAILCMHRLTAALLKTTASSGITAPEVFTTVPQMPTSQSIQGFK